MSTPGQQGPGGTRYFGPLPRSMARPHVTGGPFARTPSRDRIMSLDPLIFIEAHLDDILIYGLPVMFMVLDTAMKALAGQKDFSGLPADASLAGLSLFAGTAATLVARNMVPGRATVSAFIGFFVALFFWFLCLKLTERHRKKATGDALLKPDLPSFALGALVVAFCWNGSRYLLNHFSFPI